MMATDTPADVAVEQENAFPLARTRRIFPLIRDFAIHNRFTYESCIDIGCGRSRHDRWFSKFPQSSSTATYVALDTDQKIIDELRADGVDARNPEADDTAGLMSDLTLCVEVVEHLLPRDMHGFLEYARDSTRALIAFTTPNFEYWNGVRAKPEYKECRWIPDHFPFFNPQGGPHEHKQRMTPTGFSESLANALPEADWAFQVMRAWPWTLRDETTEAEFVLAFKIFALAWRRDVTVDGFTGIPLP
jgi:hypothetical protein